MDPQVSQGMQTHIALVIAVIVLIINFRLFLSEAFHEYHFSKSLCFISVTFPIQPKSPNSHLSLARVLKIQPMVSVIPHVHVFVLDLL